MKCIKLIMLIHNKVLKTDYFICSLMDAYNAHALYIQLLPLSIPCSSMIVNYYLLNTAANSAYSNRFMMLQLILQQCDLFKKLNQNVYIC